MLTSFLVTIEHEEKDIDFVEQEVDNFLAMLTQAEGVTNVVVSMIRDDGNHDVTNYV